MRERQQVQIAHPSRQRLRDALVQTELLRAGKDEQAHTTISIQTGLQVGKQFRRPLHLIQNRPVRELREKPARIAQRKLALVRVFQRTVRLAGKHGLCQRGLARLARAGKRHGWIPCGELLQGGSG